DLPLAAAQAAGYLEQTDLPPADYLRRFRSHRADLLSRGDVVGYSGRLDTTWALSLERLRCKDPAAVQLLELAAFLAPEPIPLALFGGHADLLEEPLRAAAADPDALTDTVGALVGYSLACRQAVSFRVHRLVQAAIRHQLSRDRQQATAQRVVALLAVAAPGHPDDPVAWAGYAALAPHVLATGPLSDHDPAGRHLILDTIRYLHARGDCHGSRAVCEPLLDRWQAILGPDHSDTLAAASTLILALRSVGEAAPARALGQDTLQRCRRVLGPDHSTTLLAAASLTGALAQLGAAEPARTLGEDTLQRCRQVLGPDHPTTLVSATALIAALNQLGQVKSACALGEDTLQRCRRVLGPDHSNSLLAAAGLTLALAQLGEAEPARALGEDALQRCRRVRGPDHPLTLVAAAALTVALGQVGEAELARALGQTTLQRCRRVLGAEHPITICMAQDASMGHLLLGDDAAVDVAS
ncbi:MAG TPA: FxSxx-COOH system tetratricopeptide repeat protein, partial [Actinomycetes bacterium]|nr:FxSxx-COOH system tetratricopeptide repeat protein [Actinomycetes bacterium]